MRSRDEVNKAVGAIMKQFRIERGMNQGEVAKKLGCDRSNIARYETVGVSGVSIMIDFCEIMEIDPVHFFTRFSTLLSGGKTPVSAKALKGRLVQGCEDLCAREGIKCIISVTIVR